jgi:cyclic di-GMP phosphodiesterase
MDIRHLNNENSDILVVDDDPGVRRMIKRILGRSGYRVRTAHDGQEAYDIIAESLPDLIILDLSMPMISGFEVASQLKSDPTTREIPIILITGLDNSENHVKALDIGINDFLSKTAEPEEILARTRSHLRIKHLNDQLNNYRISLEKTVDLRTAQLKNASLEVIWRLTAASECRDNETGAHIKRMSHYSAAIARKMGLAKKTIETILYSAPMHDIGKIGIPDGILLKPAKLDAEEWQIMKSHTIIGANILKGSKIGFVRMGAMIALTHHEKWDGSGYPVGLKGRQIPLAGRIVALADVFDALTSKRPYKKAFSVEEANRIIEQGRQKHFDPVVMDAFFAIQDEILEIKERFLDQQQDAMFSMNPMLIDGAVDSLFKGKILCN